MSRALALVETVIERDALSKIRDAQRAWEQYRDLECRFSRLRFAGGSAEPMAEAICRQALALEREAELQRIVSDWSER